MGGGSDFEGKNVVIWRFLRLRGRQGLDWPMRTKDIVKLAKKREMLTCFKFISSKLEPAGTRGRVVEAGIVKLG